jgi:hypothetical protein
VLAVLLLTISAGGLVGCSGPPQVVQIAPARGAGEVPSSQPVQIRFDRAMDRGSVASHFRVVPAVVGVLGWSSDRELSFEHQPFNPSSRYQVVLDPGYRDAAGGANTLRHSWTFVTEAPPALTGSAPAGGERNVDPASTMTLTFSREMDTGTLAGALALSPAAPFSVHADPADPRRVVLAPRSLLQPGSNYTVTLGRDARDVDGNHLGSGATLSFSTGDSRPLHHWIGFIAEPAGSNSASGAGVWVVNEDRIPRQVVGGAVSAFSWSPDGSRLLVRDQDGAWSDQPLAGPATPLGVRADWAGYLANGLGYAFLTGTSLGVLAPDGHLTQVASGVTEAAPAPDGGTIAFVVGGHGAIGRGSEIDAYDVSLRSRYRLQVEPEAVDGLAWSPDQTALAYRIDAGDPLRRQVRVRSLRDGSLTTVAVGSLSRPQWQADRQHIYVTAPVSTPTAVVTRAFRFAIGAQSQPASPRASDGLPADTGVDVTAISPSADGHQVAFVSDAAGPPAVWLMNADGTGLAQLTAYDASTFPFSTRSVAWTPT